MGDNNRLAGKFSIRCALCQQRIDLLFQLLFFPRIKMARHGGRTNVHAGSPEQNVYSNRIESACRQVTYENDA